MGAGRERAHMNRSWRVLPRRWARTLGRGGGGAPTAASTAAQCVTASLAANTVSAAARCVANRGSPAPPSSCNSSQVQVSAAEPEQMTGRTPIWCTGEHQRLLHLVQQHYSARSRLRLLDDDLIAAAAPTSDCATRCKKQLIAAAGQ